MATLPKWTEERTAELEGYAADESPVSQATVAEVAEKMGTTTRSISSKLRKMGYDVELASAAAKAKAFSEEQEQELRNLVEANEGVYTYAELADAFGQGFSAKQVQGKVLSMELTSFIKPTPKKETVKTYTDEEEAIFVNMASDGAFLEEIAAKLGKELNSVRGKALSLMRSGDIAAIPKQRDVKGKTKNDPLSAITDIASYTVEQLAEELQKTVRGVKTMLTRRGITVSDYDGAARKAKAAEAEAE